MGRTGRIQLDSPIPWGTGLDCAGSVCGRHTVDPDMHYRQIRMAPGSVPEAGRLLSRGSEALLFCGIPSEGRFLKGPAVEHARTRIRVAYKDCHYERFHASSYPTLDLVSPAGWYRGLLYHNLSGLRAPPPDRPHSLLRCW